MPPRAFLGIGAAGFLCEAVVLTIVASWTGVGPVLGRFVSFPAAVTLTWLLNRRFVFESRRDLAPAVEYAGYFAIQVIGAVINLAAYMSSLWVWPMLGAVPIVPLAIGSGTAMMFNFLMLRWLLYRGRPSRSSATACSQPVGQAGKLVSNQADGSGRPTGNPAGTDGCT